MHFTEIS